MRKTIVLLTLVGMVMPLAAHALNERVWLGVNGGIGTYDMSELNGEITAFNAANPGFTFPLLSDGMSLGLAVGVDASHGWSYGLGIDRLHANTKASDASGSLEYQLTANAWHAFGEYAFRTVGRASFALGGGIGLIAENGNLIDSQPNLAPAKYKLTGSSPMYEAHLGGRWWAAPRLAVVGSVGYRYARIRELKLEGGSMITGTGEALAADYSGPFVRLGIRLAGNIEDEAP
jgi:hypothetical protein